MKLIGVALRKPSMTEFTAAAVMGSGLWIAAVGLARVTHLELDRHQAGALLVVMLGASLAARFGVRVGMGPRHLAANALLSAALLGLYEFATMLSG